MLTSKAESKHELDAGDKMDNTVFSKLQPLVFKLVFNTTGRGTNGPTFTPTGPQTCSAQSQQRHIQHHSGYDQQQGRGVLLGLHRGNERCDHPVGSQEKGTLNLATDQTSPSFYQAGCHNQNSFCNFPQEIFVQSMFNVLRRQALIIFSTSGQSNNM
jgi:hypothetical protein